jgi:hypothetical protein
MNATVIGRGAIEIVEIVSIATDMQTLIVAIVPVLAHLNMIHMRPSAAEPSRIERRATGITIALDCLHLDVLVGMRSASIALAEAQQVIITLVSDVSEKLSVSGLTSVEPTRVSQALACSIMAMVPVVLHQLGAAGRVTRAQASVKARYVQPLYVHRHMLPFEMLTV